MVTKESAGTNRLRKELILFGVLFLIGLLVLPVVIFVVGKAVFSNYGGGGLADFVGGVLRRVFTGEAAALLLVLSPYLLWQVLRLSLLALRWPTQATK